MWKAEIGGLPPHAPKEKRAVLAAPVEIFKIRKDLRNSLNLFDFSQPQNLSDYCLSGGMRNKKGTGVLPQSLNICNYYSYGP